MKAKKSLGQNFLKSRGVVRKMVETAQITPADTVLEVGPGKGILTEGLLEAGARVIAVEKDEQLAAFLREKFKTDIQKKKLCLLSDDILKIDVSNVCSKFQVSSFKVVANIPYYITGKFLQDFLSAENQPKSITILVQKEVAERIARDTKESILSLSVKAYGTPKYIQTVKAREFTPKPNVDSAILHIGAISRDFFHLGVSPLSGGVDEKNFFLVVKAGFAHKRKLLTNNLKRLYPNFIAMQEVFEKCAIAHNARAEDVPLGGWACLTELISLES